MKLRSILSAALLVAAFAFAQAQPKVKTGIEVLRDRGFEGLIGKRVGILTNPSGIDSQFNSTIDIIAAQPGIKLVALYGPEHGVRGDAYAGAAVTDEKDPATGVQVFSVYGKYREPSAEMLKGVDVVVYDIQDVATRSYTFISSLGLMMRACAKNNVEVMVLDRPNPINGLKVEGNLMEDGYFSFVGEFKIPYVYGLTVGELAMLINEEGLNCGEKGDEAPLKCKLTVIPMEGWTRDMTYAQTGLPWVLPSPNIPTAQSAIDYPSSGLIGEYQNYLHIGIGYTLPFQTFAAEFIDADALKAKLDSYNIPGTIFRTIHYKPMSGAYQGKLLHGVQYAYSDYDKAVLTLTQFYVMQAVHELYPEVNPFAETSRNRMFDQVCGTDFVRRTMEKSFKVSDIYDYWMKDVKSFTALSAKYKIY